ncbi:MAG TPA: cytochrome c [Bryobacteraceae bacterium]|nr:cytochrome c [Bryobacteraceae bacterium]
MRAPGRVFLLLLTAGLSAAAQEYPELTAWMKASGAASGTLQKLERKTGPQAVSAAERLGGVFENMIGFWRQLKLDDAVKWSAEGKAAAAQLANAAYAEDAAAAETAFARLGAACHSCHEAYREKLAGGKYRIRIEPKEPR